MGRRPNPLMTEFFQRGAKMQDQSNRYEQTCKRCNRNFDKGRYEAMVPHLTKGCPNISYAERAKIIFRLHDLAVPNVHPYIDPTYNPNGGGNETAAREDEQIQTNSFLAEPSDNNQVPHDVHPAGPETNNRVQHSDGLDVLFEASQRVDHITNSNASYTLPDGLTYVPLDPQLDLTDHLAANPVNSQVGHPNNIPGLPLGVSGALDLSVTVPADIQMFNDVPGKQLEEPQPQGADETPIRQLRPIAILGERQVALTSGDAGTRTQVSSRQQRIRGSFAPDRRDEVRKMRGVRACMRCRMLRKSCSTETPCLTCSSVEVPRLWKVSCVRTKLGEEFPLYFTRPYTTLAHRKLEAMKKQANSNAVTGSLEVYHLENKLSFKARLFPIVSMSMNGDHQHYVEDEMIALDLETDNLLPKVEMYLQAISSQVIKKEPWPAIRISLGLAKENKEQQAYDLLDGDSAKSDNLISHVLELWVATVVMTDINLAALFTKNDVLGAGRSVVDGITHPVSHEMLTIQLRAAIEKRADILAKTVLHSFEQRIVRNKCKNYETMLIAFVLMSCAERMCWLYKTWSLPTAVYPLEGDPSRYVEKAGLFAEMIQKLLRLRHSEPKITKNPQTGAWVASNPDDTALNNWLTAVGFTDNLPEHFGPGYFSPHDSRSLDGTFSARLFQVAPPA